MNAYEMSVDATDFDAIRSGSNPMLIRLDVGFKMKDQVRLTRCIGPGIRDVDPRAPILTGWIAAITRGGSAGLRPGYAVLSLADFVAHDSRLDAKCLPYRVGDHAGMEVPKSR